MHCRKNFVDLMEDELNRLADAFNAIHSQGVIGMHADMHDQYFSNGIHRGPAFLPWHRYMMHEIERALQVVDSRVMLPFWDWTRADSQDLDAEPWRSFFGGRGGKGRFPTWDFTRASDGGGNSLPALDSVIDELQAATFADFRSLEFGSHVNAHVWVGNTMAGTRSPLDPLFYLHHCNVDRLWAIWQLNHRSVNQYTLDDCSGCLRIDSTFVPLNSPMVGGVTPASMLDHTALGYFYHKDDLLESRVLARGMPAIISGDATEIHLQTPQVIFNDVPEGDTTKRAVLFEIAGCGSLSFEVANGPTSPFSLFDPGPFPYPAAMGLPTEQLRIWIMYTGRAPGTVDSGVITIVARNEFGDEVHRWENIPIFANSVARPRVAVSLVLDDSGSMLYDAGYGRTRLQVLQIAATTFVDQLFDDNGIAMVAFANTATRMMDLQAADVLTSSVRNEARNKIAMHGPPDVYQHTSIGAGLQESANIYATSPVASDYDIKSTVVFTDGFEDRAPLISQVQTLINERVYAVGVADAANVQNDILQRLAANTGGFMLVTGAIPQDDQFILEKFFIQVLVGVTNRAIVRDPDGWLTPGQIARVPFSITRSDIAFDAVALLRAPRFVAIALQTPDGTVVNQAQVAPGQFRPGSTTNSFRITLPLVIDGKEHWEGEWQLLLAMLPSRDVALTAVLNPGFGQVAALPFHALMHARSNLNMRASISQTGLAPGSQINLRAIVTEYGQPLETHPVLVATMTRPDRTTSTLSFVEAGLGEFEASVIAAQAGVYRFLVHADGFSGRGQAFTREQLLTAVFGFQSDQPSPGSEEPDHDKLCEFLKCLMSGGVLTESFIRRLEVLGINVGQLQKCIAGICRPTNEVDDMIK